MCRWNAYIGSPLLIDVLLYRTQHGLIDESLHSRMGAETTNGDGFGLGWYAEGFAEPCRYRSVNPAWNDQNLRDMASHIESPLFLAHIRAAIGSPVQQTNCHPFQHGKWLFVHNGFIDGFKSMRRDLMLRMDEQHFEALEGSTDSETLFRLALTLGLEEDPLGALEQAIGIVEETAGADGIEHPMQGTLGLSDGERLWAVRYSSAHESRSLFYSEDVATLRRLNPDEARLAHFADDARVVVSEPVGDLPGAWIEVPESTALIIQPGQLEQVPFQPRRPSGSPAAVA